MDKPVQSTLRRAAWEVAALADEDRAWIVGQLTPEERQQLTGVLGAAETAQQSTPSVAPVADISGLPRWLGARALLALPEDRRTVQLKRTRLVDRLKMTAAVREAKQAPLTPLAGEILVACLGERAEVTT
jgi:hypothetical protein